MFDKRTLNLKYILNLFLIFLNLYQITTQCTYAQQSQIPLSTLSYPHVTTNAGIVFIVPNSHTLPTGFSRYTYANGNTYNAQLRTIMSTWGIVAFQDGQMKGSGYGYAMQTTIESGVGDIFIVTIVCGVRNCQTLATSNTCQTCNSNYIITITTQRCVLNAIVPNCIVYNDDKLTCYICGTNFKLTYTSGKCVSSLVNTNCQIYRNDETSCHQCATNYKFTQTTARCVLNTVVPNCQVYLDTQTACYQCATNYKLTQTTGKCVINTVKPNCQIYKDTQTTCHQCDSNYKLTQTTLQCVINTTIPNCQIYEDNKLKCYTCATNYKLTQTTGKCVLNTVAPNCQIYNNNQTNCYACATNYKLTQTTKLCVINTVIPNCQIYQDNQLRCYTCATNYKFTQSTARCVLNTVVPNCQIYLDTQTACYQCAINYKLTQTTGKCILNTVVPNCQIYLNSQTGCYQCATNYKFTQNTARCVLNTVVSNCQIYYDSQTKCYTCSTSYMPTYTSGKCVINSVVSHCQIYQNDELRCYQCETDYKLTQTTGKCIINTVVDYCQIYKDNQYQCFACTTDYKLTQTTGECVYYTTVPGCDIFNDNEIQCFACEYGYTLTRTSGKCINSNLVPQCQIYNDDQTTCFQCTSNYKPVINYLTCVDANLILYCQVYQILTSQCHTCRVGISYLDPVSKICLQCTLPYCNQCLNNTYCNICIDNTAYQLSIDHTQKFCQFPRCLNQIYQNGQYICAYCSQSKNFILYNGSCICKNGYEINNLLQKCTQICGDKLTFQVQCDDGNLNDNDGCSHQCLLQTQFQCSVTHAETICKKQILLDLKIVKIVKNQNNSALIKIQATNQYFPFPFTLNYFRSSNISKKFVKIELVISQNPYQTFIIQSQIIYSSINQIQVLIHYNFSIQGLPAIITINTENTKYICENDQVKLNFQMIGSNNKLQIMKYQQLYQGIQTGMYCNTIITNLLLILGLLSYKYIGLQSVITLQLIYYSQLLIQPQAKWPIGFQSISFLKYSTGYNDIFQQDIDFIPLTPIQKKLSFMEIKKIPLLNYNLSFLILFLTFLIFLISAITNFCIEIFNRINQKKLRSNIIQKQDRKLNKVQNQKQNQSFLKVKQFLDISYRSISQISKWSILQILNCFSAFIQISSNHYRSKNLNLGFIFEINSINSIILYISFFIIITVGLNNFYNIYLNQLTYSSFKRRPEQLIYKQLNFIYLLIIGFLIFFMNQVTIFKMKMSMFVLIFQLLYTIIINFIIKPYKNALKIHQRVLIIQHLICFIFLVQINLINYIEEINDIILIIFGYLTMVLCSFVIIFTTIRLYYQYRYGQALQNKIKQQQQLQQKAKLQKQQQRLKLKIEKFQMQAKKRLQQKQQKQKNNLNLKHNQYIYQNYLIQQQKQDFIEFLQKRNHLSQQQKNKLYFDNYGQKPMKWLENNDKNKYEEILKKQIFKSKSKINKKQMLKFNQNQQFKQLKIQMLNKYKQKSKSNLKQLRKDININKQKRPKKLKK